MNDTLGSVLLVEDEPQIRMTMSHILTRKGYRVEEFGNAEDALERMDRGNSISLVVIDVQLPGMSGVDLADEIAKKHSGVPVMFVTGDPNQVTKPGYIVLGKPVINKEFLDHVWQHVKLGQMMLNFREVKEGTNANLVAMSEVKAVVQKMGDTFERHTKAEVDARAKQDESIFSLSSRIESAHREATAAGSRADAAGTRADSAGTKADAANTKVDNLNPLNWKEKYPLLFGVIGLLVSAMTVLAGVIIWFTASYKEDLIEKAGNIDARIDRKIVVVQGDVKKVSDKVEIVDRSMIRQEVKVNELERGQGTIDRKMDRLLYHFRVAPAPAPPVMSSPRSGP